EPDRLGGRLQGLDEDLLGTPARGSLDLDLVSAGREGVLAPPHLFPIALAIDEDFAPWADGQHQCPRWTGRRSLGRAGLAVSGSPSGRGVALPAGFRGGSGLDFWRLDGWHRRGRLRGSVTQGRWRWRRDSGRGRTGRGAKEGDRGHEYSDSDRASAHR